jgi:hypothetical protein
MKKYLFLIALSCGLLSCNAVMMKMYGIKDPEIENEKSICKKALKYDLDTTNILTVYSTEFPKKLRSTSIPDVAIYDSKGKYIEYRQTDTSCNAGLFQFIPDLKKGAAYNQPDSAALQTEMMKFRDMKGNKVEMPEQADFYVVIYWAVWAGKLNKDHVKVWEDLAKNNRQANIKVIKANLDMQEYWPEADKEKIVGGMGKKKKK